jgi:hypothetical protein
VALAYDINFTDDDDSFIWQFHSSGIYSSVFIWGD